MRKDKLVTHILAVTVIITLSLFQIAMLMASVGVCSRESVMARTYTRRKINSEDAARARYEKTWEKRNGDLIRVLPLKRGSVDSVLTNWKKITTLRTCLLGRLRKEANASCSTHLTVVGLELSVVGIDIYCYGRKSSHPCEGVNLPNLHVNLSPTEVARTRAKGVIITNPYGPPVWATPSNDAPLVVKCRQKFPTGSRK